MDLSKPPVPVQTPADLSQDVADLASRMMQEFAAFERIEACVRARQDPNAKPVGFPLLETSANGKLRMVFDISTYAPEIATALLQVFKTDYAQRLTNTITVLRSRLNEFESILAQEITQGPTNGTVTTSVSGSKS